jgi:fructokinase
VQHVDVLGALRFEGIPCKFDTDVNAPALWEFKHNSASGATSCAYITIGTGVGVGLVVNGETVTGLVHPEGGHVALQHGDAGFEGACPFHKDCVEGLTATHALAAKARCDPWDLPGLPNDHQVWDHAAHTIAGLCCTLVYVVSPERIVIGGGVMNRTVLYQLVKVIQILSPTFMIVLLSTG